MDFELKTLTLATICNEKADALIVLVPEGLVAGDDAVSTLAALAIKSGDFETKPGKLLSAYRTAGIAAPRVLLAGVGDASVKSVRTALTAATNSLKTGNAQRAIVCLNALTDLQPETVRAGHRRGGGLSAVAPSLVAAFGSCGIGNCGHPCRTDLKITLPRPLPFTNESPMLSLAQPVEWA